MPAGSVTLGSKIEIYTGNNGLQNKQKLLIYAHGEQRWTLNVLSKFQPHAAMTGAHIHFYSRHGTVLHTAFNTIANQTVGAYKVKQPFDWCSDYNLMKVLGYHADPFTYFGAINKAIDNFTDAQRGTSKATLINHGVANMDVLVPRYKPFKKELTLKGCLDKLSALGYVYTEIHCLFCRSNTVLPSPVAHV
jgi:hypothetical protein